MPAPKFAPSWKAVSLSSPQASAKGTSTDWQQLKCTSVRARRPWVSSILVIAVLSLCSVKHVAMLFKQAVELDMGMSTLADCVKLDEEYLRRRRANSIANVKRTNGRLRFEQIARDANGGGDDEWQN